MLVASQQEIIRQSLMDVSTEKLLNDKWNQDELIDEDYGSKVMQTGQSKDR